MTFGLTNYPYLAHNTQVSWQWEDGFTSVFDGSINSYLASTLMKCQEIKDFEKVFEV